MQRTAEVKNVKAVNVKTNKNGKKISWSEKKKSSAKSFQNNNGKFSRRNFKDVYVRSIGSDIIKAGAERNLR